MLNNINDLLLVAGQQSSPEYEPYNEVTQWVATDGTQYIDTGFIADQNSKIEIGLNILDTGTAVKAVFGSRNWNGSTVSKAFYFYKINGTTVQVGWGSQSKNIALDNATELQAPMRLIIDKGSVTLVTSAKTYTETFTSETFETATSLIIGTSRTGTSGTEFDNRPASVDVRYCKLWNNGTLAYNYYPALDNQLKPCLYDKISKTFAYAKKISDGTTTYDLTFKRWNKFDVDYIQSSGTQYINTGFKFTNTSAFEMVCAKVSAYNESSVLCGARDNTDTTTNARIVDYSYSAPSVLRGEYLLLQRGGYDVNENVIYIPYDTDFHTYYQSPTRMSIDDTDRPTVPSLVSPNMDFYIFWQNVGTATAPNKSSIKVKSCKLWDNGTLVRDLKPSVWHNSDTTAVACLYDEVYNKMYTNAGTGSFKAYIVGADDTVYEVGKSVSGTPSSSVSGVSNCFDTGLYGTQDTIVKHIAIAYDSDSTSGQLFGSYDSTQTTSKNLTINSTGSSGNTAPIRFDGKVISTPIRIAINKTVSIINSKYGVWVNDNLHGSWGSVNDFTTLTTMLILKCNNSTNVRNNGCGYCMIIEKDVPMAEYIPVKNGSTIGLYDKVSKTLNTGEGTINFNALD